MNLTAPQTSRLDGDLYAALYRTHYAEVESLCRSMLGSAVQAEDAASEVFARLPRAMETYDPSLPFPQWLARVARNYCIDALRRRRSEWRVVERTGLLAGEQAASPLDLVLRAEFESVVRNALTSLPERYLVPSVLRYYSELSYEEIARTLGIRRGSVALLIYRAKAQLRKKLGRQRGPWLCFRSPDSSGRMGTTPMNRGRLPLPGRLAAPIATGVGPRNIQ